MGGCSGGGSGGGGVVVVSGVGIGCCGACGSGGDGGGDSSGVDGKTHTVTFHVLEVYVRIRNQ